MFLKYKEATKKEEMLYKYGENNVGEGSKMKSKSCKKR